MHTIRLRRLVYVVWVIRRIGLIAWLCWLRCYLLDVIDGVEEITGQIYFLLLYLLLVGEDWGKLPKTEAHPKRVKVVVRLCLALRQGNCQRLGNSLLIPSFIALIYLRNVVNRLLKVSMQDRRRQHTRNCVLQEVVRVDFRLRNRQSCADRHWHWHWAVDAHDALKHFVVLFDLVNSLRVLYHQNHSLLVQCLGSLLIGDSWRRNQFGYPDQLLDRHHVDLDVLVLPSKYLVALVGLHWQLLKVVVFCCVSALQPADQILVLLLRFVYVLYDLLVALLLAQWEPSEARINQLGWNFVVVLIGQDGRPHLDLPLLAERYFDLAFLEFQHAAFRVRKLSLLVLGCVRVKEQWLKGDTSVDCPWLGLLGILILNVAWQLFFAFWGELCFFWAAFATVLVMLFLFVLGLLDHFNFFPEGFSGFLVYLQRVCRNCLLFVVVLSNLCKWLLIPLLLHLAKHDALELLDFVEIGNKKLYKLELELLLGKFAGHVWTVNELDEQFLELLTCLEVLYHVVVPLPEYLILDHLHFVLTISILAQLRVL